MNRMSSALSAWDAVMPLKKKQLQGTKILPSLLYFVNKIANIMESMVTKKKHK